MSTRHAAPGAPLSDERYLSAPEYVDQWGLSGVAVAAKAAFVDNPQLSSLIWFLHALSGRPGGLGKVAQDVVGIFSDLIGSSAIHAFGIKPGQIYDAAQVRTVRSEIEGRSWGHNGDEYWGRWPLVGDRDERKP